MQALVNYPNEKDNAALDSQVTKAVYYLLLISASAAISGFMQTCFWQWVSERLSKVCIYKYICQIDAYPSLTNKILFFGLLSLSIYTQRIREEYVAAIFRQDTAWFERTSAGDISTRIISDILTIQEGTGSKVAVLFQVS